MSSSSSLPTQRDSGVQAGRSPASGFTLLELMIATVLSLVISAMMFSVLTSQEKTAGQNETNARMQEQLRFALQVMSRQVRMAGYGVGYKLTGTQTLRDVPTMATCDNCGNYGGDEHAGIPDTVGSDQLLLVYRNPAKEFQLDRGYYQMYPTACSANNLISSKELVSQVSLSRGETIVCQDESQLNAANTLAWTVAVNVTTGGATAPGAAVPVVPNDDPSFNALCNDNLPARMTCGSIDGSFIGFYLSGGTLWMDDNGDSVNTSTFALTMAAPGNTDDIPLARGIEDMQFAYCVVNPLGSFQQQAEDVQLCMQDQTATVWLQPGQLMADYVNLLPFVRAVRITLVARGDLDRSGRSFVSGRPSIENHAPGDTADAGTVPASTRYPRMVQSTIVQLPNIRYLYGIATEFTKK